MKAVSFDIDVMLHVAMAMKLMMRHIILLAWPVKRAHHGLDLCPIALRVNIFMSFGIPQYNELNNTAKVPDPYTKRNAILRDIHLEKIYLIFKDLLTWGQAEEYCEGF